MKQFTIDKVLITSFGCLSRVSVTLDGGLNLMALPNESGKTTFASFIKFMLYGFAGTRIKGIDGNEKAKYMPWSGESAEGAIEVTFGGERYRIERSVTPSGKEKLAVTDILTRKPAMVGEVPGEVLLGVGEELYAKTAFFKQLFETQNGDKALADQIKNIAISADEKDSATKAEKRLTQIKGELTNQQHHGLIHTLESEIEAYNAKYTEAASANEHIAELSTKIAENEYKIKIAKQKLEALDKEKLAIDNYEAYRTLLKLREFTDARAKAEQEYNDAAAGFDGDALAVELGANGLLSKFTRYNADCEARDKASANADKCRADAANAEQSLGAFASFDGDASELASSIGTKKIIGVLLLVLAAGIAVGGVIAGGVLTYVLAAAAAVSLILGIVQFAGVSKQVKKYGFKSVAEMKAKLSVLPAELAAYRSAQNAAMSAEKELDIARNACDSSLLELENGISHCCALNPEMGYEDQINAIFASSRRIDALRAELDAAKRSEDNAYADVDLDDLSVKAKASGGRAPQRDVKTVDNETRFYTMQVQNLTKINGDYDRERAVLRAKHGDAALLKGKLDAAQSKLKRLNEFCSAVTLAREVLNETGEYIKSSVSPRISDAAGKYFDTMTSGKYTTLQSGSDLSLTFGDGFEERSYEYLSTGTRECAYIALRLSLADVMYPSVSVPLMFDDAFVCLDDDRLTQMTNLLCDMSKDRQIVLISCTEREKHIIKDKGIQCNIAELKQC